MRSSLGATKNLGGTAHESTPVATGLSQMRTTHNVRKIAFLSRDLLRALHLKLGWITGNRSSDLRFETNRVPTQFWI